MSNWWDKQIKRANDLAEQSDASQPLMKFYWHLLTSQKEIYKTLRSYEQWQPSGRVETDVALLSTKLQPVLQTVQSHGPTPLASEAETLIQSPNRLNELLIEYWNNPTDVQFFGKACLQPYFKFLSDAGVSLARGLVKSASRCPFCGGRPQVTFLENKEQNADAGTRYLLCGTCLTSWEFRRVVCANCAEEEPAKLGYFQSAQFDHVRIEACDSCKHYIKGVDLTRLGYAVPLVDEIHAAALDLWALERGYKKIELNLVGM